MTTLEELKSYLEIPDPAGAVMVTGKWGSGKTYLIEHDLQNAVKEQYIILKISLFGLTDTRAINHAVKKSWIDAYLDKLDVKQISDVGGNAMNFAKNLPIPNAVKDLMNINPIDYIQIKNKIGNRKVVLVFDDLERCRMSIVDILGCINSYCENLKFQTIIIANEERIHDTKSGEAITIDISDKNTQLLYKEIKEKIVLRTLYYRPNYEEIIYSIISGLKAREEYVTFILENKDRISTLFVKAEAVCLNNIRCVKCSLQDFSRLYYLLCIKGIKHIEEWLEPFFLFEAAVRNGIIQNKDAIEAVDEFKKISEPYCNSYYFIRGVAEWIMRGIWDNDGIDREIQYFKEIQDLDNDFDRMRLGLIIKLEDTVIKNGFKPLTDKAYIGELSIDDYLMLLQNIEIARSVHYRFDTTISGEKLQEGLERCFERIYVGEIKDNCLVDVAEVKKEMSPETNQYIIDILNKIDDFRNSKKQEELDKEAQYITAISKGITYLRSNHQGIVLDGITTEIVEKTYEKFSASNNDEKYGFSSVFRQIFGHLPLNSDNTKQLNYFLIRLKELKNNYDSNEMQIASFHTLELIKTVGELLEQ